MGQLGGTPSSVPRGWEVSVKAEEKHPYLAIVKCQTCYSFPSAPEDPFTAANLRWAKLWGVSVQADIPNVSLATKGHRIFLLHCLSSYRVTLLVRALLP